MRRILIGCLALVGTLGTATTAAAFDPSSFVNPFVGTDRGARNFGTGGGAGNTFPGAVVPFGMVQLSPDTAPGKRAFGGGYTYGDNRIKGFSLKHLSGPGCPAYQDFSLTPTTAPIGRSPASGPSGNLKRRYRARFSHRRERARPGYYGVTLDPGSGRAIDARLTATTRTGFGRFTYPRTRRASLLINAGSSAPTSSGAGVQIDAANREVSGSVTSGGFCSQGNTYRLYFAAQFNRAFRAHGTWQRKGLVEGGTSSADALPGGGAQSGAYLTFNARKHRVVQARVGLSFVSVDNARANLAAESLGRGFGKVRRGARARWNGMLRRIRVDGGPLALKRLFYTQLYHALIHPSTFSDANGQYTGFDGQVHSASGATQYADFSGWDTYRTQMPLLAMLAPERASDMVRSLVATAAESGYLPKWSQANGHTHVMVGDPADALIAGAYAYGARGFDVGAALDAMVRGATVYGSAAGTPAYYPRPGLPDYLALGYVPHELNVAAGGQVDPQAVWGSAATTLEYAVADFAIAQLAAASCEQATYATFIARSANWRNVFDPAVRRVLPRYANGAFARQKPGRGEGFVEGNSAQYTFFVPHDPAGLVDALGGRKAALTRLRRFFRRINAGPHSPHAFLGNEPSLGTPWLYNWLGRPQRAQEIVRHALTRLYRDAPGGYPGNDDLGAMSSWWVFGALGIYPAVPGSDVLALGSPLFRRATVRLPQGKLRITAPNASADAPYVRGLRLNGKRHRRAWVRFRSLERGGRLAFALGRRPARGFGGAKVPPSFGPERPLRC
jgi:predicted alpha-1,2-mannosidase